MYGGGAAAVESERTAFRNAEKLYKLYKSLPSSNSSSRRRQKQSPLLRQTDLSEVIDFTAIVYDYRISGELPPGIFKFQCPNFSAPVFCLREKPGFFFIPGALSIEEQCQLVRESLEIYPEPPNRTNHTAIYGPINDLFESARRKKFLTKKLDCNGIEFSHTLVSINDDECNTGEFSLPALSLLRKLRWCTLGLQFDWSKRGYDVSLPHKEIPSGLCSLAKMMAIPAMPPGEEFRPEAAIVNYFGPSDMLGGHLDDMEADWSKPIVSISLGCKAIFLLGGKSRDVAPSAMFLRSGDIMLMAGEARECFHGVPRIFTDEENAEVSSLLSYFSSDEDVCLREYMKSSRININIRQVF